MTFADLCLYIVEMSHLETSYSNNFGWGCLGLYPVESSKSPRVKVLQPLSTSPSDLQSLQWKSFFFCQIRTFHILIYDTSWVIPSHTPQERTCLHLLGDVPLWRLLLGPLEPSLHQAERWFIWLKEVQITLKSTCAFDLFSTSVF